MAQGAPAEAQAGSPSPPPSPSLAELVAFAHELADEARRIVPQYFRRRLEVDTKADLSPVTIADLEVERAVRALLAQRFPLHAVLGEEGGAGPAEGAGGLAEWVWVVDPIDGTASFITGKPLFGVLIALLHRGVPVLGILEQPILGERWVGCQGTPTALNGRPVQVRRAPSLASSYLYTTSPHLFPAPHAERAFEAVRARVKRVNYGCDCYAFGLLALGFVDVALEFGVKPWDFLALVPIVEGAGGVMSDWKGQPLRLTSLDPADWPSHILAAGSPEVHQEALQLLAWDQ